MMDFKLSLDRTSTDVGDIKESYKAFEEYMYSIF